MTGYVPLSPMQHQYLWLRATGRGEIETQNIMGTTATHGISHRVKAKLGASTLLHAVFIAVQEDLIGPRLECGSVRGVRRHQGKHEDLCRACLRANGENIEREDARPETPPVLTGDESQLIDLMAEGLTFDQIIEKTGRGHTAMSVIRAGLYRKLGISHLPKQQKRARALEEARAFGIVPGRKPRTTVTPSPRRWGTTDLTALEQRTLAVLADGKSLTAAGVDLGIPGPAVSSRLAIIYKKLDVVHLVRNDKRQAAIKIARERGYPV